jgi:2'-5' RNA ligase
MRCFVSIDIPRNIKSEITKIQKQLPFFNGKITENENLHLTLKFLGRIDDNTVIKVEKALKKIKLKQFEVEINSIGIFTNRIIWLNVKNCNELQKQVDKKLEILFEKEQRFMGHLTIARIKKIDDWKDFKDKLNKIKIPKMNFIVKNFNLKKSQLTRKGPIYQNLKTYTLKI